MSTGPKPISNTETLYATLLYRQQEAEGLGDDLPAALRVYEHLQVDKEEISKQKKALEDLEKVSEKISKIIHKKIELGAQALMATTVLLSLPPPYTGSSSSSSSQPSFSSSPFASSREQLSLIKPPASKRIYRDPTFLISSPPFGLLIIDTRIIGLKLGENGEWAEMTEKPAAVLIDILGCAFGEKEPYPKKEQLKKIFEKCITPQELIDELFMEQKIFRTQPTVLIFILETLQELKVTIDLNDLCARSKLNKKKLLQFYSTNPRISELLKSVSTESYL